MQAMKDTIPAARTESARRVLVVDDSALQRKLLSANLSQWGYRIFEASSGDDALEICQSTQIDMILSDWVMPNMDGLDFCRAFRALDRDHYGYFILLTSKDDKSEVAVGLDVGADDFLTKPVNSSELRARLHAGERVLGMQQELVEKNAAISKKMKELQGLYQAIDRDLQEAKKLQHSLVPEPFQQFENATVSLILQSSGHVGGDMIGYYFKSKTRLGLYALDVSGHGISSALMTARMASYLSVANPAYSLAMERLANGEYQPRPPAEIVSDLNARMLDDIDTDLYMTILLVDIDLTTGNARILQAGHPHPLIQRKDGKLEYVGHGGLPVGLIPMAQFQEFEVALGEGDRLIVHSDGFTEAAKKTGEMLDEAGFALLIKSNAEIEGLELLSKLVSEVESFSGTEEMADDLSAIALEFRPQTS